MKFNFAVGELFGLESEAIDVQTARQTALEELVEQQRQAHGQLTVKGQLPESRHMTMSRRPTPHREPRASYEALKAQDLKLVEDGVEQLPDWPFGPEAMERSQAICQRRRARRLER